jgi:hypothetical protein
MNIRTQQFVYGMVLIAIYVMLGLVGEVGHLIQLGINSAAVGWVLNDVVKAIIKD